MKRGVLLILVLGAGSLYAQQQMGTDANDSSSRSGSSKTVHISAEVVSTDADAKTITVRPASSSSSSTTGTSGTSATSATDQTRTLMVDTKAAASLKSVKFGDKVTLTCSSSDMSSGSSGSSYGTSGSTGTTTSGSTTGDTGTTSGTTGSTTSGTTGSTGTSTSGTGTSATGTSGTGSSSYGSSTGMSDFARNCATVTSISKSKATTQDNR